MNDILVTIFCTSYNHEKYIARMLSSLINQKVDFNYEILIHDDASTDKTQEIILSFVDKYPELFHAILQKENQWSKGISFIKKIVMPYAKGKYIAICEGDDCWIDEYKLQKQVDYMEAHSGCSFCFTNAIIENIQNGKKRVFVPYSSNDKKYINASGDYTLLEIARLSFIPTCTFLFPKDNLYLVPETFFDRHYCGDRKMTLYFTSLGYAHFIDENTGCYNYGVAGSAMTKKKTKKQLAIEELSFARMYQNVNEFTKYKYTEQLSEYIDFYLLEVFYLQGNNKLLTEDDYEYLKNKINTVCKVKKMLFMLLPDRFLDALRAIKRKLFV